MFHPRKVILRGHNEDFKGDPKPATEPVKNNGFNPLWNKTFTFKIKVPDVALLELKVGHPIISSTIKALLEGAKTPSDFYKVCCFLQLPI